MIVSNISKFVAKNTSEFIKKVGEAYLTGHAREHAYRPALQGLFEAITGLRLVNDPKRSENGAPDFVFLNKNIVTAYAEAKDLNVSLEAIEKSDQMNRYYGYSNIILTNCLEFRFYKSGQQYVAPIVIAELKDGRVNFFEDQFGYLEDTIRDFIKDSKEPIKSGIHLAKVMAGKARRIRDNITAFLGQEDNAKNENLLAVYEVIKKLLLADLDKTKFADMYAQTLVYGLFVARYYDESNDNFSRQEARDLVPASNPFLRHFFDHIAGSSFDPRIEIIVNELCEEFTHADVRAIVHNYYKVDKDDSRDPIIHFYEDFLQEYDSSERKKMGVFYTPLPVVRFIIRSVDSILKKEFDLAEGLVDSSKIEVVREVQGKKQKVSVHRVQVLDPATGTGTFLNEAILHIKKHFEGQEGRWSGYVNEDLLPRLHGFELMMASYTIAHLKLSSTIRETGAKIENTRLGVYLTNSLEKGEEAPKTLFDIGLGKALTEESNQASKVKNRLPIMVVIGNPPYSGESSNAFYSEHDVYKTEPTGGKLQERNSKWLNDDYVKFLRFAENMIEKTGEGVVGMITAHGYIDNPTFRGMRFHLMETFDDIYVLDLHGNAKKKEKSPDGSKDENVFSIQQGVAIIFGIKHKIKGRKGLANIYRADCFGNRMAKFDFLNQNSIDSVKWDRIAPAKPNYEWVARDEKVSGEYQAGFSIADLFPVSSVGIVTSRDQFVIDSDKGVLAKRMQGFLACQSAQDAATKFDLKENQKWKVASALKHVFDESNIVPISYRPFDTRFIYYDDDFIERSRVSVMKNMLAGNIGLIARRQMPEGKATYFFVSKYVLADGYIRSDNKGSESIFPLYIQGADGTLKENLNSVIVSKIEKIIGKASASDIFDYIYAILYSSRYRKKYDAFLKIDFPRVPYPANAEIYQKLVSLGREIKSLHLLESTKLSKLITTYPVSGDNAVQNIEYTSGKVYINPEQYFGSVPEVAWNSFVGAYQPAQKWLKDRKGKVLTNAEIEHYQKMIVSLVESDRLIKEIDELEFF